MSLSLNEICELIRTRNELEISELAPNTINAYQGLSTPMIMLGVEGDFDSIQYALKELGGNIHQAVEGLAEGGWTNRVESLLIDGADINNALEGAARGGHIESANHYIDRGGCIDYATRGSAQAGVLYTKMVETYLNQGGDNLWALTGFARSNQHHRVVWLFEKIITQAIQQLEEEKKITKDQSGVLSTILTEEVVFWDTPYLRAITSALKLEQENKFTKDQIDFLLTLLKRKEDVYNSPDLEAMLSVLEAMFSFIKAMRSFKNHREITDYLKNVIDEAIRYIALGYAQTGDKETERRIGKISNSMIKGLAFGGHFELVNQYLNYKNCTFWGSLNYFFNSRIPVVPVYHMRGAVEGYALGGHVVQVEKLLNQGGTIKDAINGFEQGEHISLKLWCSIRHERLRLALSRHKELEEDSQFITKVNTLMTEHDLNFEQAIMAAELIFEHDLPDEQSIRHIEVTTRMANFS